MPDINDITPESAAAEDAAVTNLANASPAPPPPQVTPPPTSTPVEQTTPTTFNQNAQAQIENTANSKQATQELTAAERAQAQGEADLRKSQIDEEKAKLSDMSQFADQSLAIHNKNQVDQAAELKRIGAIKLDPDHWWNSKDTGGKVAAIGGLLLGGLGQGLLMWGGNKSAHNAGIDAMEEAVKNDIDSQDKNLKNQWNTYAAQNDLTNNDENYRKFAMQHKQQQLVNGMQVAKDQLLQQAAQSKDPVIQAQGKQAALAFDAKIAEYRRDQGLHAEQQAAAVAAQLRAVQQKDLDYQRSLQVLGITGAQKLEEEGVKAAGELAKYKTEAPEKEHAAELAQINSERVRLNQQQLQAHNGWIPWDTTKEKMAAKNLEDLDKREEAANKKYVESKKESTGPTVVNSAKDLP